MKLFNIAKIPMTLTALVHGVEERDEVEEKIVQMTLRVAPLDAALASTIAGGIVRPTLFKLTTGTPHEHLKKVEFALGLRRQRLHVFAARDSQKASAMLDQVRVLSTIARTEKNLTDAYAFLWRGSVGPLGKTELAYLQAWLLSERFVSLEVAEPGFFDDDVVDSETETTSEEPAIDFDANLEAPVK